MRLKTWGGPQGRVEFHGPFPPPMHGQAAATVAMANELEKRGVVLSRFDTSVRPAVGIRYILNRASNALAEISSIGTSRNVGTTYLSVNAGAGMWLTALLSFVARSRGRTVILHHHTYRHVRNRTLAGVSLARAAGGGAIHLSLSPSMTAALVAAYPEIRNVSEVNNSGLVEAPSGLPSPDISSISIGLLSNLSYDKGVPDFIRLATELLRRDQDASAHLAGPVQDARLTPAIASAGEEFGSRFRYWGPVDSRGRNEFFRSVNAFVFLSRYANEASPLVVLEAMSHGVPVLATKVGAVEDLVTARSGATLPTGALTPDVLKALDRVLEGLKDGSLRPRAQFDDLRQQHGSQLDALVRLLKTPTSVAQATREATP